MYTYNNPEKAMENRFALTTLATNDSLSDTVQEMKFLPNQNIFVAGTWEGLIRFYDIQKNYSNLAVGLQHVIQVNEPIICLDVHHNGQIVFVGCADFTIRAYQVDPRSPQQPQLVGQHENAPARNIFWNKELDLLISIGFDKKIYFWKMNQSQPALQLQCQDIPLVAAQSQTNGYFAYTDRSNQIYITKWDRLKSVNPNNQSSIFQCLDSPTKKESQITSIAISEGEKRSYSNFESVKCLGIGTLDGRANISSIDTNSLKLNHLLTYKAHKIEEQNYNTMKKSVVYSVSSLQFNNLAYKKWVSTTGSNGEIIFWDLEQKNKIKQFQYNGNITASQVNEEGNFFIFGIGYDWHKGMERIGSVKSQVGAIEITKELLHC